MSTGSLSTSIAFAVKNIITDVLFFPVATTTSDTPYRFGIIAGPTIV
jgi:hypothetical protein